jgi:CheY-like chemotaxis protein
VRVLLADNDAEWLDLVALDLGLEGHDIVGRATSGADALALVAELGSRVEVAVVDHRMPPGITGLEVVQELSRTRPELHVILFTNYPDPTLAEEVEAAGAALVPKHSLRRLREALEAGPVNRPGRPPRR